MDLNLINLLVNTGFAGLFIYLLIETRKENRLDKDKAEQRETRLHNLITSITSNYANMAGNIQHIAKFMADNTATNQRVAGVLDGISAMMRRMQLEVGQIQGQLGMMKAGITHEIEQHQGVGNEE